MRKGTGAGVWSIWHRRPGDANLLVGHQESVMALPVSPVKYSFGRRDSLIKKPPFSEIAHTYVDADTKAIAALITEEEDDPRTAEALQSAEARQTHKRKLSIGIKRDKFSDPREIRAPVEKLSDGRPLYAFGRRNSTAVRAPFSEMRHALEANADTANFARLITTEKVEGERNLRTFTNSGNSVTTTSVEPASGPSGGSSIVSSTTSIAPKVARTMPNLVLVPETDRREHARVNLMRNLLKKTGNSATMEVARRSGSSVVQPTPPKAPRQAESSKGASPGPPRRFTVIQLDTNKPVALDDSALALMSEQRSAQLQEGKHNAEEDGAVLESRTARDATEWVRFKESLEESMHGISIGEPSSSMTVTMTTSFDETDASTSKARRMVDSMGMEDSLNMTFDPSYVSAAAPSLNSSTTIPSSGQRHSYLTHEQRDKVDQTRRRKFFSTVPGSEEAFLATHGLSSWAASAAGGGPSHTLDADSSLFTEATLSHSVPPGGVSAGVSVANSVLSQATSPTKQTGSTFRNGSYIEPSELDKLSTFTDGPYMSVEERKRADAAASRAKFLHGPFVATFGSPKPGSTKAAWGKDEPRLYLGAQGPHVTSDPQTKNWGLTGIQPKDWVLFKGEHRDKWVGPAWKATVPTEKRNNIIMPPPLLTDTARKSTKRLTATTGTGNISNASTLRR